MEKSNARVAALAALQKCRKSGAWSDAVLGSVMDSHNLESRERALCTALCFSVQQHMLFLDHAINCYSATNTNKLEPKVLDILRLGACQILFMDKIPASAAVNESVKICRSSGMSRAAGLVNAVLRRISENKDSIPEPKGSECEKLSVKHSFPLELTEYLHKTLGSECEKFMAECNAPVPITAQVNTLKTETEKLLSAWRENGVEAELHPYMPDCIVLGSVGAVTGLPGFAEGHFYIQDTAAKLSVMAAAPQKGDRILDTCSAPGGKSFASAILSGGAEIVSCDLHENKLKRIRESAERLSIENLTTRCADGRVFVPEFEEHFDVVITDVPCSGLGVIRKKPDIRYKSTAEFDSLPAIQLDILKNASRYVKRGGTLLYSTCTIRPEENEEIIEHFLSENGEYEREDFALCGDMSSERGMITLYPHIHQTDGFFICKLRKKV
ncbi:MAG: 16S rRNA (cytosine(967)-C(5))-methyltransferase RsmB [Oscillospiraceae bacterium]|nr:16S rRNA (cytosine(967)-C(5))-methyltransferase RsmB [Oscillospiraceae bacterium]